MSNAKPLVGLIFLSKLLHFDNTCTNLVNIFMRQGDTVILFNSASRHLCGSRIAKKLLDGFHEQSQYL